MISLETKVDEIREKMRLVTPGPWGWFGRSNQRMYLATRRWGRYYIMDACRLGMQGAQFEFQDVLIEEKDGEWHVERTNGSPGPQKARDIAIFEVAPEATSEDDPRVYRTDIIGFRSDNATFIANSREYVDILLARIDELEQELTLEGKRQV